jgi:hypothetical protein
MKTAPSSATATACVSMRPPVWRWLDDAADGTAVGLPGSAARFEADPFVVICRLTEPGAGLRLTPHPVSAQPPDSAPELLAVHPATTGKPPALADAWIRDGDLTASYETNDARRLGITVMWRCHAADAKPWGEALSLPLALVAEAVVSSQTSRIESDGAVTVAARVQAADISSTPNAVLFRDVSGLGAAGPWSLLFAVHPHDCRGISLRRGLVGPVGGSAGREHVAVSCPLFPSVIEKGVLHRSRVIAALGPAAEDTAWMTALLRAFAASPPVLTT